MGITFETDNNIIVYALEKIISYAWEHQYIFIAHCVWWLASSIGLQQGLVIPIDNLRKQSEVYLVPNAISSDTINIHPDRILLIEGQNPIQEIQSDCGNSDIGESESR